MGLCQRTYWGTCDNLSYTGLINRFCFLFEKLNINGQSCSPTNEGAKQTFQWCISFVATTFCSVCIFLNTTASHCVPRISEVSLLSMRLPCTHLHPCSCCPRSFSLASKIETSFLPLCPPPGSSDSDHRPPHPVRQSQPLGEAVSSTCKAQCQKRRGREPSGNSRCCPWS